jgi:hypothetical protein
MDIIDIEDIRVQSQLSESCHFIKIDGIHYMCIAGIVMRYNIGVIIIIAALSKRPIDLDNAYSGMAILNHIGDMNKNDLKLQDSIENKCSYRYVVQHIKKYIIDWDKKQLEKLIPYDMISLN